MFVRFWRERRKTEVAGDKPVGARKRTNIAPVSGSLSAEWKQWRRISQVNPPIEGNISDVWVIHHVHEGCSKLLSMHTHTHTHRPLNPNINGTLCCLPHLLHINAYVVASRKQTASYSGRNWNFSSHPPDFDHSRYKGDKLAVLRVSAITGVVYNIITTTYLRISYLFFFIMFESLFTFLPRKFYFCQIIGETKVSWL